MAKVVLQIVTVLMQIFFRKLFSVQNQQTLRTYLKQLYSPEREEVLRNNAGRISFSEPFF